MTHVEDNTHMVRRQFLRHGLIGGLALITPSYFPFFSDSVEAMPEANDRVGVRLMIEALISTGNPACMSAAAKLERSWKSEAHYDLHLRSASLDNLDAEIIAGAMGRPEFTKGPALRSFSMSYNKDLKDEGVVVLTKSLPATLEELGFVGCEIGDEGGAALLRWASQAAGLKMMCVERNRFSEKIRQGFALLKQERENLLIFV